MKSEVQEQAEKMSNFEGKKMINCTKEIIGPNWPTKNQQELATLEIIVNISYSMDINIPAI